MTELPGLFVVGTDTGVGKTYVAALIARDLTREGRRVGLLKPVATGAIVGESGRPVVDDADRLIEAVGGGIDINDVCPIFYAEPLAPPVAARRSGRPLEWAEVETATLAAIGRWRDRGADLMVVEGVGGLLCPLAEGKSVADLAIRLDYPLVVVARRGLGTLNHTLLTVEAALGRGLRVAGVVLNGPEPTADPLAEATNPEELARHLGPIPILGEIPHGAGRPGAFDSCGADWYHRAACPRLIPPRP